MAIFMNFLLKTWMKKFDPHHHYASLSFSDSNTFGQHFLKSFPLVIEIPKIWRKKGCQLIHKKKNTINNIGYTNLIKINLHPNWMLLPLLYTYILRLFLLTQRQHPNTKGRSWNETTNVIPKFIDWKPPTFFDTVHSPFPQFYHFNHPPSYS